MLYHFRRTDKPLNHFDASLVKLIDYAGLISSDTELIGQTRIRHTTLTLSFYWDFDLTRDKQIELYYTVDKMRNSA